MPAIESEVKPPSPQNPHPMTEPTRRAKRRGCGLTLALVFGLPALLWVLATWYTGAQFNAELERLRKAGEPLDLSDLVPQVPAGEQNAANLYLQAFSTRRSISGTDDLAGVPHAQWSKQDWAVARSYVQVNQQYFDLLDQAARLRSCAFPLDPNDPFALHSEYSAMREAARVLSIRAEVQAADGQADAALLTCLATEKLAETAQSFPELIGATAYFSVQGMALREIGRVLSAGDASAATCRAIYAQLDDSAWRQAWVHAMQGERAYDLACFAMFEQGAFNSQMVGPVTSKDGLQLSLYMTLGRPLWNGEKLANLEISAKKIDMMQLPWAQAAQKRDEIIREEAALPRYYSDFTRSSIRPIVNLPPMPMLLLQYKMEGSARLRAAQIALAAKAYKGEHGAYPTSLADLPKADWKLPSDPFTDQPYHYQQSAKGFIVYSVGPDLTDNGGTDFDWNRFKLDQPGYDFVFRVAR